MEVFNKWDCDLETSCGKILAGDETRLCQHNPEKETQPKQWLPRCRNDPIKQEQGSWQQLFGGMLKAFCLLTDWRVKEW